MRRRRWELLGGAVVVAVMAIAAIPAIRGFGRGSGVPVMQVSRGPFAHRIQAEGNLKPVQATPINVPMEATAPLKIAWLAPDGGRVKAGEVVIRFDPTDMEKGLADGEAERDSANQRIVGKTAEGAGVLKNLDRDAGIASLDLQYARDFQPKDPEIFSRSQIIESQIDEGLAKQRKDSAEDVRTIRGRLNQADIDLLAIERHKAQLKIDQARKGLSALEVKAPHDGILVLQRDWNGVPKVGDTTYRGELLAEIPQMSAMEALVYVLEADAGGLAPGRQAEVVLEAHPDLVFKAKVKKVDALAKPRVNWVPVQYFGVTLELERTDTALMKPGQRLQATLLLDERASAIAIPRSAVFDQDGKRIVYRRKGWGFEPVEVVLGPSALGRVVIDKGLENGDVLALRDPNRSASETGAAGKGAPEREAGRGAPGVVR
jgi:multidrug efflux pump subunit AcrA (membrane-fusion protein)